MFITEGIYESPEFSEAFLYACAYTLDECIRFCYFDRDECMAYCCI